MCSIAITEDLNINFVATNIILQMKGEFSVNQICDEIGSYNYKVPRKKLLKIIENLRENDYLRESGYKYSVVPIKDSMRWG